jgi:hypothetical protein
MADTLYVLGSLEQENREVVFVPDGVDTDLPAGAQFTYAQAFSKFPYSEF